MVLRGAGARTLGPTMLLVCLAWALPFGAAHPLPTEPFLDEDESCLLDGGAGTECSTGTHRHYLSTGHYFTGPVGEGTATSTLTFDNGVVWELECRFYGEGAPYACHGSTGWVPPLGSFVHDCAVRAGELQVECRVTH